MWFKKKENKIEEVKFEKSKIKRIANSFKYAWKGIFSAFKSERNMKIHFLMMLLVVVCGITFEISLFEWQLCIILFGIVIAFEIINTAIEVVVDLVMPNIDSRAKLAKDLAAGAVLVVATSAAFIGLTIFIPKFLELLK
jgi:Diacylglycerol kinase